MMVEFEANGILAIRHFTANGTISDNDRAHIADLWAVQMLRTRVIRAGVAEFLKETVITTARVLDTQGKFPPPTGVLSRIRK